MPRLTAYFDGGCNPNPLGHAAAACVIMRGKEEVYRKSRYLGCGAGMTNNVAEYAGLKLILDYLVVNPEACIIYGDAQIVINRMNNRSSSPGVGACASWAGECKLLNHQLRGLVEYQWHRRNKNEECDAMCNAEMELAIRGKR